jgi:hypothetical protein
MRLSRLRILFGSVLGVTSLGARGGCGSAPCYAVPPNTAHEPLRLDDPKYKVLTAAPNGAALQPEQCEHFCHAGEPFVGCRRVDDESGPGVDCDYGASQRCEGAGRRTAGLYQRGMRRGDPTSSLGLYFERMAYLEAASVLSFRRLRAELQCHRAPRRLVRAASRAVGDEIKHARRMTRLALRHGVRPASPALEPTPPRSLAELAIENAVEGCVGETHGALVTAFQSRHAPTPSLRAVFRRIARDELRHAELAWDLAGWLERRLTPAERRACDDALSDALARLSQHEGHDPGLGAALGLPHPRVASRLKRELAAALAAT